MNGKSIIDINKQGHKIAAVVVVSVNGYKQSRPAKNHMSVAVAMSIHVHMHTHAKKKKKIDR